MVDRAEQVALVALLQSRPQKIPWSEVAAEVVASGSAVDLWARLVADALIEQPGEPDPLVQAAQDIDRWRAAGTEFVTIMDPRYPTRLRGVHEAPPIVYFRGELVGDDLAVSVVGSRNASEKSLRMAGGIANELVRRGLAVASGLAAGIDTAAHRAALDAGGRTVAVIGTGINKVYPAANRGLQDEIGERCLVLSQFWPDAPPQKHTFLMRNATMSGYGLATVVVEAGEQSGARVQARRAVAHGRPVILTDLVVDNNEWAKELVGRPGVHVATGLHDVAVIVQELLDSRAAEESALHRLVSA